MAESKLQNGVAFTDVLNIHVYDGPTCQDLQDWKEMTPREIYETVKAQSATEEAMIDHLASAALTVDGPTTEIKGGMYNNTLIKSGKTGRCEMTDALADVHALESLGLIELSEGSDYQDWVITQNFAGTKLLIGDTVVADRKTGAMVPVHVIIFQFRPDSIPSFSFEAGNNATIDMNGDMLCTDIKLHDNDAGTVGAFWALIDDETPYPTQCETNAKNY